MRMSLCVYANYLVHKSAAWYVVGVCESTTKHYVKIIQMCLIKLREGEITTHDAALAYVVEQISILG